MWIQNCQCDDTTGVGTTVDVTDGVRDKMISRKSHNDFSKLYTQKQSSIGALMESCSENDFNKVVLFCKGCSPVNLMHIFRTPFPKNTYGGLLLYTALLEDDKTVLLKLPFQIRLLNVLIRICLFQKSAANFNPSRPVHFWKSYWNKNQVKFLFSHSFVVSQRVLWRP